MNLAQTNGKAVTISKLEDIFINEIVKPSILLDAREKYEIQSIDNYREGGKFVYIDLVKMIKYYNAQIRKNKQLKELGCKKLPVWKLDSYFKEKEG